MYLIQDISSESFWCHQSHGRLENPHTKSLNGGFSAGKSLISMVRFPARHVWFERNSYSEKIVVIAKKKHFGDYKQTNFKSVLNVAVTTPASLHISRMGLFIDIDRVFKKNRAMIYGLIWLAVLKRRYITTMLLNTSEYLIPYAPWVICWW